MIHRHRKQPSAEFQGYAVQKMQQRNRIAAAGYGNGDRAFQIENSMGRQQQSGIKRLILLPVRRGYWHPSPCIDTCALVAWMLPGKRLPTSASVTQASGVWPKAPKACPSFSSDSPAKLPSGLPENASR